MQLKIRKADGNSAVYPVTPAIEVAFERHFKGGFYRLLAEEQRSEHACWLAWECLRRSGEVVPPFGDDFLDTLAGIDIVDDDPNG